MSIRVLRILEYEYDTIESMSYFMDMWKVPAVGVVRHGAETIRSTVMFPHAVEGAADDSADAG